MDETTVTPTTNDDGATYMVKLDGVADDDGVISLSVGSNTITVEVTAEDGQAVKTYTVTVTRAGTTAPTDQSKPTAPTISSIAITSSPNDDAVIIVDGEREKVGDWRVYGIDDSIEVTVAFSAGVTVTGVPRLELDVGGSAKAAEYKSTARQQPEIQLYGCGKRRGHGRGLHKSQQADPERWNNSWGCQPGRRPLSRNLGAAEQT